MFFRCRLVRSKEDKISTSRYCVFVGGNLISWKSNNQNVISRSSTKLVYGAMVQSVCEIMWIRWLLMEVGIEISVPTKLWYDNQVAKHIAYNLVFHKQTKRIEIDYHFVRKKIRLGLIFTRYVMTRE